MAIIMDEMSVEDPWRKEVLLNAFYVSFIESLAMNDSSVASS